MSLWKMEDSADGKPKYVDQSSVEGDASANVYGVSVDEMAAQEGKLAHPGWVKRTVGTGGRAGRVFQEVLVAASSMTGDATPTDDEVYPDVNLKITTQPQSQSVEQPNPATFSVVAETNTGTITYQWQEDPNTGTFADMVGETNDSVTIADSTGKNDYKYQCVVTVVDAAEVTSDSATLTVTIP